MNKKKMVIVIVLVIGLTGLYFSVRKGRNGQPGQSSQEKQEPINAEEYICLDDDDCCKESHEFIVKNNYSRIGVSESCPVGFQKNMLRCISSLQWCEPKQPLSTQPEVAPDKTDTQSSPSGSVEEP